MTKQDELARLQETLSSLLADLEQRRKYLESWRSAEGQVADAGSPFAEPIKVMADSDDPFQIEIKGKIKMIEEQIRSLAKE